MPDKPNYSAADDFLSAMDRLIHDPGQSAAEIEPVKGGILDMAVTAAHTPPLPHGGFALHTREGTTGPDGQPTMYVICDCGRGYAWGHYADSERLFRWLADHDADVTCPHRPSMQLDRTPPNCPRVVYCADCGQMRPTDEAANPESPFTGKISQ